MIAFFHHCEVESAIWTENDSVDDVDTLNDRGLVKIG